MSSKLESPWLIVSGGFHERGGMDKANFFLAQHLLDRGTPVHLVGHFIDARLVNHPLATIHRIVRPLHSYALGAPLLAHSAQIVYRALRRTHPNVRAVANGGNCQLADVNWVHCVHRAWRPRNGEGPGWFQLKRRFTHARACRSEIRAFRRAHLIITNSNTTKHEVERGLGHTNGLIHTVYLGSDVGVTAPTPEEKLRARIDWGISPGRKVAVFVGALGFDGNKGFDTLFKIWRSLCSGPDWDVDLLVAGAGRALADWRAKVHTAGLGDRIRCLGFCDKIPSLLTAADVLISPVRYEAYGLNVQEAICRGVPALTSARAGIAERYPGELKSMLFENPENVPGCMERIRLWRSQPEYWAEKFLRFGSSLRQRDWNIMAAELVAIIEQHCPLTAQSGVVARPAVRDTAIAAMKPSH